VFISITIKKKLSRLSSFLRQCCFLWPYVSSSHPIDHAPSVAWGKSPFRSFSIEKTRWILSRPNGFLQLNLAWMSSIRERHFEFTPIESIYSDDPWILTFGYHECTTSPYEIDLTCPWKLCPILGTNNCQECSRPPQFSSSAYVWRGRWLISGN
jgi:hypothetical protein